MLGVQTTEQNGDGDQNPRRYEEDSAEQRGEPSGAAFSVDEYLLALREHDSVSTPSSARRVNHECACREEGVEWQTSSMTAREPSRIGTVPDLDESKTIRGMRRNRLRFRLGFDASFPSVDIAS